LTSDSLQAFGQVLSLNDELTLNYLVSKLGFDPSDPGQFEQGIAVLMAKELVASTLDPHAYFCQMRESLTPEEFAECFGARQFL
jgi:hypothetical protein